MKKPFQLIHYMLFVSQAKNRSCQHNCQLILKQQIKKVMQHIKEHNRWQMELTSLDTFIAYDNPVRVIDAFADQLELDKLGFVTNQIKSEGRPSY